MLLSLIPKSPQIPVLSLILKAMRVFVVFILSLFLTTSVVAQKVYYIYLETDNSAAFYVRMADKIYSSSASGYLTISNLVDSTYKLTLGFPSGTPESKFIVPLKGKDRGFLIKHLDNGIALFDMETLSLIKPEVDQSTSKVTYQVRTDAFSTLLSKASSDSSLLLVPIQVKQEETAKADNPKEEKSKAKEAAVVDLKPKQEETTVRVDAVDSAKLKATPAPSQSDIAVVPAKPDSVSSSKTEVGVPVKGDSNALASAPAPTSNADSPASAPVQEEYKRSVVVRHSESSTSEGFGLVFYDKSQNGDADTIRLLIPNPKFTFKQDDTSLVAQTQSQPASPEVKKETSDKKEEQPETKKETTLIIPAKSNCHSVATDNDFFKLRRNMAARTDDDEMIDEAKKYFKSKCYTTEQIRNLSTLFLTAAGKYQFFDVAYTHVADQENFATLRSEIKDDYYLKRFKALIGE